MQANCIAPAFLVRDDALYIAPWKWNTTEPTLLEYAVTRAHVVSGEVNGRYTTGVSFVIEGRWHCDIWWWFRNETDIANVAICDGLGKVAFIRRKMDAETLLATISRLVADNVREGTAA
jgi:hypothetical protein